MGSSGILIVYCLLHVACGALTTEHGDHGYVEYKHESDATKQLPLIITMPHGGSLRPDTIELRTNGCYDNVIKQCIWRHGCGTTDRSRCKASTYKDSYTKEIGNMVAAKLAEMTGKQAFRVINNLHRSRMDANRDRDQGAQGDMEAEVAWDEYHNKTDEAKATIGRRALLIDMHGQGHSEQWIELGYLMSKRRLCQRNLNPNYSSIRLLAEERSETITFYDLLNIFGELLEDEDFSSIPSPSNPNAIDSQECDFNYYSGGYTIYRHGSRDGGQTDALQIELNSDARFNKREEVSEAIAKALFAYLQRFYPN